METLEWSNVSNYVADRLPFRQPLGGTRGALLVYGGLTDRMEIHLPCGGSEHLPKVKLAHLKVFVASRAGKTWMVLQGHDLSNLQPVLQLGALCATFYEPTQATASGALQSGLRAWMQMLEGRPLLSAESQLGLRGELALLRVLVASRGPAAVHSWTAYDERVAGRHDFRLDSSEIEVKSTRGNARHHWVSSLHQLVASPGQKLFLLSLQFQPPGLAAGETLPECVKAVRSLLDAAPNERDIFERRLALSLYRDDDASQYDERLHMASVPMLIPVDGQLPVLTPHTLAAAHPPQTLQRLLELKYQVDFSGLGVRAGSALFTDIVGPWNI